MPALLLIPASSRSTLALARDRLAAAGWTIAFAERAQAAAVTAERAPALVLVEDGSPPAAALARSIHRIAAVPVVLVGAAADGVTALGASGLDAGIDPDGPVGFAAAVGRWWPLAPDPVRGRLADMLGPDNYAGLTGRFGTQLREALASIEGGDQAAAARAHRVAGLAGTLGFSDVCEAWLPLSEGAADAAALGRAAVAARRALQIIAHAYSG